MHKNLKYLQWPYRAYINGGFCEGLLGENNFQIALATLYCYNYGVNAPRQFRRLQQIKKIIVNASRVL